MIPRCPYVGKCGGCQRQHLPDEQQLSNKEKEIFELFAPYCSQDTHRRSCELAEQLWNYRNKMEYTFSQDKSGNRFLGLFSSVRKRRVEHLNSCDIGPLWGTEALQLIFAWWQTSSLQAYSPSRDTGTLRTVTFRSSERTKEMMVILTVSGRPEWAPHKNDLRMFVEVLLLLEKKFQSRLSCILRVHQSIKGHPTSFFEMVLHGEGVLTERYSIQPVKGKPAIELSLQFSPQSFCQPNTPQAEKIYTHALQMLDLQPDDIVWDLFCGAGGFGLAASSFVKKVVGIELSYDSAFDATCNKELCHASNYTIERADVFDIVRSQEAMDRLGIPTLCLVDPPRSGLGDKVIHLMNSLPVEKIVYVSCNPLSQKNDMKLFHALGWQILAMQPIDQFPHTPHLENILLLSKQDFRF